MPCNESDDPRARIAQQLDVPWDDPARTAGRAIRNGSGPRAVRVDVHRHWARLWIWERAVHLTPERARETAQELLRSADEAERAALPGTEKP
jgi:hypothetical protein